MRSPITLLSSRHAISAEKSYPMNGALFAPWTPVEMHGKSIAVMLSSGKLNSPLVLISASIQALFA